MSIYAQAVTSGLSALEVLATGGNAQSRAAYDQAYNATYKTVASRQAASRARAAAESNISSIRQDKILTDTELGVRQAQAEAKARVSAAVSGSVGGSVEGSIYETHKNESLRIAENRRASEQAIEGQKSRVHGATTALLSVDNPAITEVSAIGDMMSAFSKFEMNDLKVGEAISNKLFKT